MPSESLHLLRHGTHLSLQHPHIDHSCVNQVTENSKLPFFGSELSEKSACISVEQVNILDLICICIHSYTYVHLDKSNEGTIAIDYNSYITAQPAICCYPPNSILQLDNTK